MKDIDCHYHQHNHNNNHFGIIELRLDYRKTMKKPKRPTYDDCVD